MTNLSKEFSAALFDLAMDEKREEEVLEELKLVKSVFDVTPGALSTLASPAIPRTERLALMESSLKDQVSQTVISFLAVLISRGEIRNFDDCLKGYEELYNSAKKLSTAKVFSAVELTDAEKEKLLSQLEKKLGRTIYLECSVDETLLGGLKVEVDGKVMDGSLKHRLQQIKEVMNA